MRRPLARWILPLGIVASSPLGAQSAPKAAMGIPVPMSDVRSDWLDGGVESPNGRFYLLNSYASNDSGFLRYDRVKRSWAHLGRGITGLNERWSPDGRFVAYMRRAEENNEWQVWLVPMDTATGLASGAARRVSMRPITEAGPGLVAWSPDGRRIAFISRDTANAFIVAVPFNGGDGQELFRVPGHLNSLIWSRDARFIFVNHVASGRPPGRTLRVSLNDKSAIELRAAYAPTIDISADGKWLAQFGGNRPVLYLVSTDGKSVRHVDLPQSLGRLSPVGWSRSNPNEFIAVDRFAPTAVQRVSTADGRIGTVVAFDSAGLGDAALSPDDQQVAYVRLHGGVKQLALSDTAGGHTRALVDGAERPVWSPNGRHVAYRTSTADIAVVEVASRKARDLVPSQETECPLRAHCDGHFATPIQWRSDARAVRYFERRETADGPLLELREVDLEGHQRLVGRTHVAGWPSFIAGNDTLFLVQQSGPTGASLQGVQLVNSRTGAAHSIYTGATRLQENVATNGQWIFTVANRGSDGTSLVREPLLVSLTTGESKRVRYALGGEISDVYLLPDGRSLLLVACVTCRDPNFVEKWDLIVAPLNGDPPRILTSSESSFKDFSPAGLSADGRIAYFIAEQSYNTRIATLALPKF